jgi:hypothetical protein
MDLGLYARVLWRFRAIAAGGFVLAVLLAFFSVAKVGSSGISSRKGETWKTDAFLLVTQPGFPWGRTVTSYTAGDPATGQPSVPQGDPQRLSTLTALYAQIATSTVVQVKAGLVPDKPEQGAATVTAVPGPAYSNPAILPILDIQATAPTPERAAAVAERVSIAFRQWLENEQASNGIATSDRVQVQPITRATKPTLVSHTGRTLPIIVFLTVIGATIGLALVLENMRPQPVVVVETHLRAQPAAQRASRTA